MSYKYTMNPSSQMFTIFLFSTFLVYIFSESISLKYHCTFSLYKVTDFTTGESPRPLKKTFCKHQYRSRGLPGISTCYYHSYWSPWLIRHHLLLAQLPITWLSRHHLLSLTNPLSFLYQVIKYLAWTRRSDNYSTHQHDY
jgi:hypothetical protein